MDYDVLEARYLREYVVWLRFRDGSSGEVDLTPALIGPVFESLRSLNYFKQFRIDPRFHTLVWPNDEDIAPEYLHDRVGLAA
jgi:hypothetical protein